MRRSLAIEMGFVMPAVRILDNMQLDANSYVIKIKEVDAGSGKVWHGQYMVMDPSGNQVTLPGTHTTEPTFGLPATWIDASLKEEAAVKGLTVVDAATVLATHLTELIKANMSELLSYGEVQKLIKELPKEQSELIKDIVPSQINISGIQRVLQILLAERVSIRDLSTILEGIADGLPATRNAAMLAEHVRARLARQLCAQHVTPAGTLPIIALTAKWEQAFAESIVGQGDDRNLAMQPSKLTEFINLVREKFEQAAREGEAPVLVTSPVYPAVCARHHRALPRPDQRPGAVGNSPAGAAEDGRKHLRPERAPASARNQASRSTVITGNQASVKTHWATALVHLIHVNRDEPFSPSAATNRQKREVVMNHSMYSADRATHLKIVVIGLICATLVAIVGIFAQVDSNIDLGTAALGQSRPADHDERPGSGYSLNRAIRRAAARTPHPSLSYGLIPLRRMIETRYASAPRAWKRFHHLAGEQDRSGRCAARRAAGGLERHRIARPPHCIEIETRGDRAGGEFVGADHTRANAVLATCSTISHSS